jgi:hypothetical protein
MFYNVFACLSHYSGGKHNVSAIVNKRNVLQIRRYAAKGYAPSETWESDTLNERIAPLLINSVFVHNL